MQNASNIPQKVWSGAQKENLNHINQPLPKTLEVILKHFDSCPRISRRVDRPLWHHAAHVWWVVWLPISELHCCAFLRSQYLQQQKWSNLAIFVRSLAASQTPHSNLTTDKHGNQELDGIRLNMKCKTGWSHEAEAMAKPAGATDIWGKKFMKEKNIFPTLGGYKYLVMIFLNLIWSQIWSLPGWSDSRDHLSFQHASPWRPTLEFIGVCLYLCCLESGRY